MNATSLALEVHIHLNSGRALKYVGADPAVVLRMFEHIQPNRLFNQTALIVGGGTSMMTVSCASIVRVDFLTELNPGWAFPPETVDVQEVTEAEFRERYRPENYPSGLLAEAQSYQAPILIFSEIELSNGERLFLAVETIPVERLPVEQAIFLQRIFEGNGMLMRRRSGGWSLINPAHLTQLTFYPAPPTLPPGAWPLTLVRGEARPV